MPWYEQLLESLVNFFRWPTSVDDVLAWFGIIGAIVTTIQIVRFIYSGVRPSWGRPARLGSKLF